MITDFEFNGSTAKFEGLLVEHFVDIPTPKRRFTEYTLPGRDGTLIIPEDAYEDIEITVDLVYITLPDDVRQKYQETKKWLISGSGKLKFSDQQDTHYQVKRVEVNANTLKLFSVGKFKVKFICKPHRYLDGGDNSIDFSTNLYNPHDASHPTFHIEGEGMCTLSVNGKSMKANVGQNLTIDTDLMIAYRTDGKMQNTAVSGDYADLWLNAGQNTLAVSNGFTVRIIPKWRYL